MFLVKIQMTFRSIPCELMKNRIITSWGVDEIRGRQIKTGEHMDDAMHILTQSWIRKIIVLWSISDENKPKKWYSLSDKHTWLQHTLAWIETAISIKWSNLQILTWSQSILYNSSGDTIVYEYLQVPIRFRKSFGIFAFFPSILKLLIWQCHFLIK